MVKYVSFFLNGGVHGGVLDGNYIVPLGASIRKVIDEGAAGLAFAQAKLAAGEGKIPLSSVELAPPVPDPDKIFCVGLNYMDHALASGMTDETLPKEPLIFQKFRSSLCAANAPIRSFKRATCLDYEVEQVVVISKRCVDVSVDDAWGYVAGYMTGNDVSERDWQLRRNKGPTGAQWTFGKGFDTSGVCGPFMLSSDEMTPEQSMNLEINCWYNGDLVQSSNTKQHIFTTAEVISFVSGMITLEPGDLIYMGTPAGTRIETAKAKKGMKNVDWLQPGGVLKSEVQGLGVCENKILTNEEWKAQAKL
jgi:2-keto-4-pentenoate hydratase/2-oxohepta-3-ene-1,7-dioic acid hydratase in catechol pathway